MNLFYLYANANIEIHICSNKHETGLVSVNKKHKILHEFVLKYATTFEKSGEHVGFDLPMRPSIRAFKLLSYNSMYGFRNSF